MIYKSNRGITITEVLITIVVMSLVAVMATVGIKMLNFFSKQRIITDVETESQRMIYMIERDIRNSYSYDITWLDPTNKARGGNKISLAIPGRIDTYDQNLGAILAVATATISYEVVNTPGQVHLLRKIERNDGADVVSSKSLTNALDLTNALFYATPYYEGVDIKLTLAPAYWKGNNKKTYAVSVLKYFNFRQTSS